MGTITEVESGEPVKRKDDSNPRLTVLGYAGYRKDLADQGENNFLSRLFMGPVHGMMDFLHYTILRPGSGAWRMTTQLAEEAERQKLDKISKPDDPSRLKNISDVGEINPYLRAVSG